MCDVTAVAGHPSEGTWSLHGDATDVRRVARVVAPLFLGCPSIPWAVHRILFLIRVYCRYDLSWFGLDRYAKHEVVPGNGGTCTAITKQEA